ncbi:GIY-YIG nuclease family protein [Echinicola soli]|uniref:GIY-YIG nuclease family protein n=1 Tax=Echinicola soli TaxID=2591634 RepID=A0A514CDP7_9BACT|nr:GIY-YIG nuclease family protein [Echinicola soli]QDH77942.1 GIY-YIG nuclease family protein [Echinicola soli]
MQGFFYFDCMCHYFLYILYSPGLDKYYIGQTGNVGSRLAYHNEISLNRLWTCRGIPWELKSQIPFSSRSMAVKAERYLNKPEFDS